MSELSQQPEVPLAVLTGRQVDTADFYLMLLPRLYDRGINIHEYAEQQLARHRDIIRKVAKYGERAPAARYLPLVAGRLSQALSKEKPVSEDELIEMLAYLQPELSEAREHFDD